VVYLPHSLEKLPRLFEVSQRAVTTAWQNIFLFAGAVNMAAVVLAATGKLGPIAAAFTHQISSFLVMMNSLRLLRVERTRQSRLSKVIAASPIPLLWDRIRAVDVPTQFGRLVERRRQFARPALYIAAALFVLNGFYLLGPDEAGVIERFGKKVLPYSEPGIHYKLPWPVHRLTRIH